MVVLVEGCVLICVDLEVGASFVGIDGRIGDKDVRLLTHIGDLDGNELKGVSERKYSSVRNCEHTLTIGPFKVGLIGYLNGYLFDRLSILQCEISNK